MVEFVIRNAKLSDIPKISHIVKERFGKENTDVKEFYNPNSIVLIAQVGRRTVGFVRVDVSDCAIVGIAVEKSFSHRGIGTALLNSAIMLMRNMGKTKIKLNVAHANPAKRLYTRAGFFTVSISLKNGNIVELMERNENN
ncbi:MAG: GNAT family N-acetyltransferase [Candidatus Micrarchaeia archaeon]